MDKTQYNSFVSKLQEILMMNHAELDFGIYRIMNYKRKEINDFLTIKLLPQVETVLKQNIQTDGEEVRQKLEEKIAGYRKDGLDENAINNIQAIKDLRAQLASSANLDDLQSVVFSRLTQFFSRYYKDGDFVSQRRYKSNGDSSYMLPYNGEEVKLVWANQDQYYIKTSEYFKNYTFILPNSRNKVHFMLKDASTEQNNNKNQNGMERRFALYRGGVNGEEPLAVVSGELEIYFTYELMPKATKQKDLIAKAYGVLKPLIESDDRFKNWKELLMNAVKADRSLMDITWLQKHLNDYTAKNSFDYFIHKDLGGFLRRELDFYVKNEVLVIDDLTSAKMKSTLAIVKAIEQVGNKIITFLAQLEDFQKKLWLKKKFVVGCDYCITLDRIPESMYSEIVANDEQRKEWVRLFAIDEIKGDLTTEAYSEPLTIEFLKQNPFLVLDTKFFSLEFKHKLLATMENIDGQCNGLLVNSENFQATNLLRAKYSNGINCVYLDPPYNTGPTEILYKNNYKDASWLTMMQNRLENTKRLISTNSTICVAIDDYEMVKLSQELDDMFCDYFDRNMIVVKHHPQGSNKDNVSRTHEYAIILTPKGQNVLQSEKELEQEETRPLMRSGSADNNFRHGREKSFYAFLIDTVNHKVKGFEPFPPFGSSYPIEDTKEGWKRIYPISNGTERVWRISSVSPKLQIKDLNDIIKVSDSNVLYQRIKYKREPVPSIWEGGKFNAGTYGTNLLQDMFGDASVFTYPKSLYTVEEYVDSVTNEDEDSLILDFFGGSATTAHAVIDLNRRDEGMRKYMLVEMAYYFKTATMPRIEKAIYSSGWKNGKPTNRQGVSQCFKYIRLEQYEDTLSNLVPKQSMPAGDDDFQESYMLGYMLDTDTRGSLLNLKMFKHPFDVKIKTTKDNELVETPVDMVETFNYLIGLNVETESWHHGGDICVVEGKTHIGNENTLVIWRDCDKIDNDALNEFFRKQDFNTLDMEYDVIYVNGDNTLPNVRRDEDHWKVVLTEDEFKARMFEED